MRRPGIEYGFNPDKKPAKSIGDKKQIKKHDQPMTRPQPAEEETKAIMTEKELKSLMQDLWYIEIRLKDFVDAGLDQKEASDFLKNNFNADKVEMIHLVKFLKEGNQFVRQVVVHKFNEQKTFGEVW